MGWIGISNLHRATFDTRGVGTGQPALHGPDPQPSGLMARGSLVLEVTYAAQGRIPQRLLRLDRTQDWHRHLGLTLLADGVLILTQCQGTAQHQTRMVMPIPQRETRLRITFSWDAPARRGLISVENLDQETLHQREVISPLPLPIEDGRDIILGAEATRFGRELRWVALSDRVEPVGLSLGVARGTPVDTPYGLRLVEQLRPGDLVTTAHGSQPIRWITAREVPALGGLRPVLLRAPYYGLSRDILVAPDHRIVVKGAEAEYLFGEDEVLVEAHHMIDGQAIRRGPGGAGTLWYHHLLLDGHECLRFAGLWGESMFLGDIGRDADLIATTALADMPAHALPRHKRFAQPTLSSYEARTLASSLVA